ncbi:uncharacterized protein LOC131875482 [Cryptomeria japonica]|uniref:uncharacterized protein LOC131875482 n=1 Tax=Cryptomeria japonica TaxID=3369 RepID=UPI0027D9E542|nr:uncharacterized protein LOC131875482 [Cryptomeria japonica]
MAVGMHQNRCWGDEAVSDPLPPKDPFGSRTRHVLQRVFKDNKWVDVLASPTCVKTSQSDFPSSAYFKGYFRRDHNFGKWQKDRQRRNVRVFGNKAQIDLPNAFANLQPLSKDSGGHLQNLELSSQPASILIPLIDASDAILGKKAHDLRALVVVIQVWGDSIPLSKLHYKLHAHWALESWALESCGA